MAAFALRVSLNAGCPIDHCNFKTNAVLENYCNPSRRASDWAAADLIIILATHPMATMQRRHTLVFIQHKINDATCHSELQHFNALVMTVIIFSAKGGG